MTWWAIDVRTAPSRGSRSVPGWWPGPDRRWRSGTTARWSHLRRTRRRPRRWWPSWVARRMRRSEIEPPAGRAVDWSTRWRDGLGARRIGRLTIIPSWFPKLGARSAHHRARPGDRVRQRGARLDPRGADAARAHLRPGDRVLDLGSGSGILAIAAIKLGAARAIGIENDPEANEVAARNAARNGVGRTGRISRGRRGCLAPLLGPADLLLSNILRRSTPRSCRSSPALRPGGLAIFSGMEQAEADEFRPALAAAGFAEREEALDAGWWGVAAERP